MAQVVFCRCEHLAANLSEESIGRDGGNGGQEIRTWLAAAAAAGNRPMEILGYEPILFFITGMGVAASSTC